MPTSVIIGAGAGAECARAGVAHTRSATSIVSTAGSLFVCPHCGDGVEFVEPSGSPQTHPDDFRCDCGAVLELVEAAS